MSEYNEQLGGVETTVTQKTTLTIRATDVEMTLEAAGRNGLIQATGKAGAKLADTLGACGTPETLKGLGLALIVAAEKMADTLNDF